MPGPLSCESDLAECTHSTDLIIKCTASLCVALFLNIVQETSITHIDSLKIKVSLDRKRSNTMAVEWDKEASFTIKCSEKN